jgi:hypothetical protein
MEWQPIETAPKGRRVLVFMPPLPHDDDPGMVVVAMQSKSFTGWWWDDENDDLRVNPTHWQPLPDRPLSSSPE